MYEYIGSCVSLDSEKLFEMVDVAAPVSWGTISNIVGEDVINSVFPNANPPLKDDYAVRFYRSFYGMRLCFFIEHSRIEHVFSKVVT